MSRPPISSSPKRLRQQFLSLTRPPEKGMEQEEAIHQVRVLGKRLRAFLFLFREQLPQKIRHACKQKLSRSARALAPSRNARIVNDLLHKLGEETLQNTKKARAVAGKALVQKYRNTLSAVEECRNLLLEKALPEASAKDLQGQLDKSRRQTRKHALKARKSFAGQALHTWRKSLKRLFYQLELMQTEKKARQEKTGQRLKKIEKRLGRIHDWDELLDHLKRKTSRRHFKRLRPEIEKRQQKEARRAFHEFKRLKRSLAA